MKKENSSPHLQDDVRADRLRKIANAYQISCAVNAAAALRLDAYLPTEGVDIAILADRVGVSRDPFRRLLRFLAALGVVTIDAQKRVFKTDLTPMLAFSNSIAEGPAAISAWLALPDALQEEGVVPFDRAHGMSFYDFASKNSRQAKGWTKRNRDLARRWAQPVADALPLQDAETFVDIGAGGGALSEALRDRFPNLEITIADLPFVIDELAAAQKQPGANININYHSFDILEETPPPADAYMFSRVLLNLNDEEVVRALENCRKAMRPAARLFIAEILMPPDGDPQQFAHASHDLHLYVLWGGKQRTGDEYTELLDRAGLKFLETARVDKNGRFFCEIIMAESA